MSTLVVEELITTLEQEIKTYRHVNLAAIRPWVYSHGNPSGTFTFELSNSSGPIKFFSFTNNSLKQALNVTEPYFHGYYAIAMTPFILPRGTYKIKLYATGYTFDENCFFGWCKDVEPKSRTYGNIENYTANPYSFTLIEYANREQ